MRCQDVKCVCVDAIQPLKRSWTTCKKRRSHPHPHTHNAHTHTRAHARTHTQTLRALQQLIAKPPLLLQKMLPLARQHPARYQRLRPAMQPTRTQSCLQHCTTVVSPRIQCPGMTFPIHPWTSLYLLCTNGRRSFGTKRKTNCILGLPALVAFTSWHYSRIKFEPHPRHPLTKQVLLKDP